MFNYLWAADPENRDESRDAEQKRREQRAARRAATQPAADPTPHPPPVPARRQESNPQEEEDHPPRVPIRRQGSHPERLTTPRCEPLGDDPNDPEGPEDPEAPDNPPPEDGPNNPDDNPDNPDDPDDPDHPHGAHNQDMANAPITDPRQFRLKGQIQERFDIETQADRWEEWLMLWDAFMTNTGMEALDCNTEGAADEAKTAARNKKVKSALMSSFTIGTVRTIRALGMTEAQLLIPETILQAIEDHIAGSSSPRVHRVQLMSRQRKEGETFDQYLTALRLIAAKCQFPPGREEENTIILAITLGIREPEAAERLLRMPLNAPLAEMATEARAIMAAKRDHSAINRERGTRPSAHRIQTVDRPPPPPTQGRSSTGRPWEANPRPQGSRCSKCGYDAHRPPKQCPARNESCIHCGGTGHYRRMCPRTRGGHRPGPAASAAHQAPEHQTPHEDNTPHARGAFYDATPQDPYTRPTNYSAVARTSYSTIANNNARSYEKFEPLPTTQVWVGGSQTPLRFLADTGANFCVVSTRDYLKTGLSTTKVDPNSPKQEDPRMADGRGGNMGIKGVTRVTLATSTGTTEVDLYVAKNVDQPLLSRKATLALGILQEPSQ